MKNTMKKTLSLLLAAMLLASLSITAFASDDGSTSATSNDGNMSGTADLNYIVTHKNSYTDVSGVKLEWNIPVVKYEDTTVTTWDAENLMWIQSSGSSTTNNTVNFTLYNRGSYAVKANVSFELAKGLEANTEVENDVDAAGVDFGTTNDPTIASIVNDDHTLKTDSDMEAYIVNNCAATITGTITINDATKLTDTNGTLGTYTVSIRETTHTVTLNIRDGKDATEITVDDGATITFNDDKVTIAAAEYTRSGGANCWTVDGVLQENGTITVISDLTINAESAA